MASTPKLAARETSPGKFTIPVKAEEGGLVFVAAMLSDGPVDVAWQSDLPLLPASRSVTDGERLDVGGQIDRIFGGLDTAVDVLVQT